MAGKRHVFLISVLLLLQYRTGWCQQIPSDLVQNTTELINCGFGIFALCLDPLRDDLLYGVINHGVVKLNLDMETFGAGAGSTRMSGLVDGIGTSARFNSPRSCTVFGDKLAVGEINPEQDAIRLIDVTIMNVTTLIDEGEGSLVDGQITPGTGQGGGIEYPIFLHAANSTHLMVCSNIAQVRLIDTVTNEITTLIDSALGVSSFFPDIEGLGMYLVMDADRYDIFYFPIGDLLSGNLLDWHAASSPILEYTRVNTEDEIVNIVNGLGQSGLYMGSFQYHAADVGTHLIIPTGTPTVTVIEKQSRYTSSIILLDSAKAVVLPRTPGVLYVAQRSSLIKLFGESLAPPLPATTTTTTGTTTTTPTTTTTTPTTTTATPTTTTTIPATMTTAPTTTTITPTTTTTTPTTTTTTPTTTTTTPTTTTTITTTPTTTTTTPTTTATTPTTTTTTPNTTTTPTTTTTTPTTTTKTPTTTTDTPTTTTATPTTTTTTPTTTTTTPTTTTATPTTTTATPTTTTAPITTTTPNVTSTTPTNTSTTPTTTFTLTTTNPPTTTAESQKGKSQQKGSSQVLTPTTVSNLKGDSGSGDSGTSGSNSDGSESDSDGSESGSDDMIKEEITSNDQTTTILGTTTESIYSPSATVGLRGFAVRSSSACPEGAVEITAMLVESAQVCSLHCSNIQICAGFDYNKQTGKCKLLEDWSTDDEYPPLRNGIHNLCYRS